MGTAKIRQVTFKENVFDEVQELADKEQRSFKAQAAVLIEEALQHRRENVAKVEHRGQIAG